MGVEHGIKERLGSSGLVWPIMEYKSRSNRIIGDQEIVRLGLPAPEPTFVIGHEAFLGWKESGMNEELKEQVGRSFDTIREANPERGVYLGRGFFVPGVDEPAGPRTAGIFNKEIYFKELDNFYRFVVEHGYDVEEAEIALEMHPFINAFDKREYYGRVTLKEGELPWSGGYAVMSSDYESGKVVKILANFGPDEVVKHYLGDEFLVDTETENLLEKKIGYKSRTLRPKKDSSEYEPVSVPAKWRSRPALTTREVLEVADLAMAAFEKDRNLRVEFIMQPEGSVFREIAPFREWDKLELLKLKPGEEITGRVVRIEAGEDLKKIKGEEVVVYFPSEVFLNRNTDLFTLADVEAKKAGVEKLIALVYGTSMTSHAAKILLEKGYSLLPRGDIEYRDGDLVRVCCTPDNKPSVEFVDAYHDGVIDFEETEKLVKGVAGGKIANIVKVGELDYRVPEGLAITTEAVKQYLMEIGIYTDLVKLDLMPLRHTRRLAEGVEKITKRVLESELPEGLREKIEANLDDCCLDSLIVRSSGAEDNQGGSRAGLYKSSGKLEEKEAVMAAIKETIVSYFSEESIISLKQAGESILEMDMGVAVQEYIESWLGGVAFSSRDKVRIEIAGSPEEVVSGRGGLVVEIDRKTGEVRGLDEAINLGLSREFFENFYSMIRNIIELFGGRHQDIEWILTNKNELVILQARPM